jgi:hypothetical protein
MYFKPREESVVESDFVLAPLIVQEIHTTDDAATKRDRFGVVMVKGRGPKRPVESRVDMVDPTPPTVYTASSTVRLAGLDHDQRVYVWWYGSGQQHDGTDFGVDHSYEGRGIRITLGPDGFPLVWEALSTKTHTRVVFVSESLERAAERQFHGPLPGRRFSIERAFDEAPDVVVARVIDDGPMPMGPSVYLSAAPDRAVTTVLCRCMPSQVDELAETIEYELVHVETTRDPRRSEGKGRQRDKDRPFANCAVVTDLRLVDPDPEDFLERRLRWPDLRR